MVLGRQIRSKLAYLLLVASSVLACAMAHGAEPARLVLWNRNFDTAPVDRVLSLALSKTNDLYPELVVVRSPPLEQEEALNELLYGERLDVVSTAAYEAIEDAAISVRFPVLRGLLGVRVCLIRKGDQERFSAIETPYDFMSQNLKICQVAQWPDVEVLRRNGFATVTKSRYEALFSGLLNRDCDCVLRGAQEVIPEWEPRSDAIDVESRLVFKYLQPGFFHVAKSNAALAARIELGLLRALDDGSFQELVESLLGGAVERLDLDQRIEFELVNPNLSPATTSLRKYKPLWHRSAQ